MMGQIYNKRQFERTQVSFFVLYRVDSPLTVRMLVGNKEVDALALDISEMGMAVLTNYELPASTRATVKFTILRDAAAREQDQRRSLEIEGEVRYNFFVKEKKAFRIGVQFLNISADERSFIANFVRISLTKPGA